MNVKVRQLTLALNDKWTRFNNLKRDSMLGLWKLMTGWEDSCELPVRSMLISAVILIGVLRTLQCERLPEIVAQLDRHTADCKEFSWNHLIAKVATIESGADVDDYCNEQDGEHQHSTHVELVVEVRWSAVWLSSGTAVAAPTVSV